MKFIYALALAFTLSACGNNSNATSAQSSEETISISKSLPTLTGDYVWDVDKAESMLTFEATHNSETFTGTIGSFDAAIRLNPEAPSGGEIHAVIGLESLDAKDDDRNANLPTKDWFNIAQFPTAKFVSTDISLTSDGGYSAKGDLTIKGISKPITLLFSLNETDNGVIAKGESDFLRTAFNLGESSDFEDESWVGFPVSVFVSIEAKRQTAP